MPASARIIADELQEMSSPISAFVEEHCIVDECSVVQISQLFDAWEAWCKLNKTEPGSLSSFAQKLRALVPGIETFRPSMERKRPRCYRGIGFTPPYPEGYFPTLHGISKDEMQKMAEAAGFFGLSF
jgi:phage/plasmid-associated DNA primase